MTNLMMFYRTKIDDGDPGAGAPPLPTKKSTDPVADDFEALLERALRIDVPEPGAARRRPRRARAWTRMALAAAIVLAVGLTINTLHDSAFLGSDDLASDVMVHVHHEPAALIRTAETVSTAALEKVLQAAGARMSPIRSPVTYVKLCPFRGRMVAHMTVQGESGPVTVLLLPDEDVDAPMPVDEDGFVGTIVPLGAIGGSFAVVGEFAGDIGDIRNQVADAVKWRL